MLSLQKITEIFPRFDSIMLIKDHPCSQITKPRNSLIKIQKKSIDNTKKSFYLVKINKGKPELHKKKKSKSSSEKISAQSSLSQIG